MIKGEGEGPSQKVKGWYTAAVYLINRQMFLDLLRKETMSFVLSGPNKKNYYVANYNMVI